MTGNIKNKCLWSLPFAAMIVWFIFAVKYVNLTAKTGLGFLLFSVFMIFLPGYSVVSGWKVLKTAKEVIVFSFGIGILIEYILYFIFAPFHLNDYISYALVAVVAISLLILLFRWKKSRIVRVESDFDLPTFLSCAAALFITFVILSMANLEPDLVGARPYYHDTLNGVGLTVAAYKSFPMESLQMSGWVFPYHLGYYIFTSVLMTVLHTTAFVSVIKLSLILIAPLCVLAFNCIAERYINNKGLNALLTFIFAFIPSCTYTHYLYMDTIGFPFGLFLCFLAFLLFSIAQDKGNKVNLCHCFASAFLSAAMIAKGPLAVTYLFGVCFVLLIELLTQKNLWVFVKGLLYAVPCLGLYFLVYGNGAGDSMSLSYFYSAIRTPFSYSIYQRYPDWLYKTLSVLYYSSTMSFTTTISLIVIIVGCILLKKKGTYTTFSVSAVLCGMVLMNILKQSGSSEVY
ncbi:MAG: hypothetical protein IJ091_06635, partial [Oscillospiraceae bacterium]|nr:hypothetical protein [Oscillospiraceae bacterium]